MNELFWNQLAFGAAALAYLMCVVTPELRRIRRELSNLSATIAQAAGLDTRTRNH